MNNPETCNVHLSTLALVKSIKSVKLTGQKLGHEDRVTQHFHGVDFDLTNMFLDVQFTCYHCFSDIVMVIF